jgi:hypothetical protein
LKILLRAAVLITVVISLLTVAPSAWGAVRYVDAIAGIDAGECVQASPCESIAFALARPGAGDEIIVASGTYLQPVPLAVTEEVDLHGVAGDPRPVISAPGGIDAMTVGGAAAGSRFSHLHFSLQGGAVSGSNTAVRVTTPATFEDMAFTLTALFGTAERRRALLVDLPPGTAAPVVLRGATVNADSKYAGHDGAGLLETAHGTLQIRDLVLSNVANGIAALAGISAGSDTGADDAILDVDGATITTGGRCLGLFGGSAAAGSTLRNLTLTQYVDGQGVGTQATVECVRIGSRYTTIDGMKVTALEGSTDVSQHNDSAIIAWNADNLTLRRIDVTSIEPALYAGPKTGITEAVTNLQIHGARMRSMANSAVLIGNGTGRITDMLAVGGGASNTAGLHFIPQGLFGNQFALRNVTAIGGTGSPSTDGIFLDDGLTSGRAVTVTGRNVIARGSLYDVFVSTLSSLTLDHSFVATHGGTGPYAGDPSNSAGPPGFVNEAGGDYHLGTGAAAENAGVTDSFVGTEDFEGDSRVGAGNPDAGADERRPATVPETTITGAPPSSGTDPTVTFYFDSDDATATFACAVTGGAAAPCTSPFTSSELPDGLYTFSVTAANTTTGPDPTPATFQFRVDSTAPGTAIGGSALTGPTPTFALSSAGEPTATFQCALDGAAFAVCPASYNAPSLAGGQHTLRARAVDAAGNRDATPAELTFTVDATRPNTSVKGAPKGKTARFTFTSTEAGSSFQCKLDKKAWASCKSPKSYKKLKKGKHTFLVRAIDKVGNVDATPAKRSWRIR